jgi:NitT/TauT family transport system substrate-binding protein
VGRKTHRLPAVPVPSYTEELVKRLKDTLIEGDNGFLAGLDPQQTARDLVDDRFVRNAIAAVGGMQTFGIAETSSAARSSAV